MVMLMLKMNIMDGNGFVDTEGGGGVHDNETYKDNDAHNGNGNGNDNENDDDSDSDNESLLMIMITVIM